MNESTMNKLGACIFGLLVFVLIWFFILLTWGFIELVQWVTSK